MRICSAAQLHTAPLSQTPAPLAPTCDCVLSLLGPRNNSLGVRVAVHLSGKSPEVKYRHCTYGPSGDICCVRGLKTTLEWKMKKKPHQIPYSLTGIPTTASKLPVARFQPNFQCLLTQQGRQQLSSILSIGIVEYSNPKDTTMATP